MIEDENYQHPDEVDHHTGNPLKENNEVVTSTEYEDPKHKDNQYYRDLQNYSKSRQSGWTMFISITVPVGSVIRVVCTSITTSSATYQMVN